MVAYCQRVLIAIALLVYWTASHADAFHLISEKQAQDIIQRIGQSSAQTNEFVALSLEGHELDSNEGMVADISWAPATTLKEGSHIVEKIDALRNDTLEICAPSYCLDIITNQQVATEGRLLDAFILCKSLVIGEQKGPPAQCRIAMVVLNRVAYIPYIEGWTKTQEFANTPNIDFAIFANKKINTDALLASIRKEIQLEPLFLNTNPQSSLAHSPRSGNRLIAVFERQFLKLIRKFAWIGVEIELYEPRSDSTPSMREGEFELQYELHVNASLLINPQNTSRERDWHLPSNSVATNYMQELKIVISSAIRDRCEKSTMDDASTLICIPGKDLTEAPEKLETKKSIPEEKPAAEVAGKGVIL